MKVAGRSLDKSAWSANVWTIFHLYHIAVFFWIILGLVWLSGLISISIGDFDDKNALEIFISFETLWLAEQKNRITVMGIWPIIILLKIVFNYQMKEATWSFVKFTFIFWRKLILEMKNFRFSTTGGMEISKRLKNLICFKFLNLGSWAIQNQRIV